MNDSDAQLVTQAQGGDQAAFEELVRRTSRLVYARLYLETADCHRAEDLLQETLLRAYRSLEKLRDPLSLRPWLFTIAQHVLTDQVRYDSRRKTVEGLSLAEVPTRARSPDEEAVLSELRAKVLVVLKSLLEEYRMPISLRYLAGADYKAIETQLGLTNGALRGLLHRGLKMLRERMGEEA